MKHTLTKSFFIFLILTLLVSTLAIPALATGTETPDGTNGGTAGGMHMGNTSGTGGTGGTTSGTGDVSGAIEDTWNTAKDQVKSIVNNVVFPVIDTILVILFFVKIGTSYFEYRKFGRFEFVAPCVIFGCLIFTLTAPLYIWNIL